MRAIVILSVLSIVGLAACEGDSTPAVTVTDSAGIRVTLSPDVPTTFAEVDPQPVLSLGGPNDSGPTLFYRIQHVHVDPRGRLWVADGQSGELRIFLADGSHWKTRGGRGEGPGEFLRIRLLGSFRGDSVAVWDNANGRLTLFDAEGEFVRTQRVPPGDDPRPRAFHVFDDGSVLGQVPRILDAGSLEAGQVLGDSVQLVRVDLEGSTQRPQGGALGPLWLWTGRNQIRIPFTINSSFVVYDESVQLVTGSAFRVRVFEGGRLSEIYGVARDAREVSGDDIEAYREFVEEYVPESQRNESLSALRHPRRPTVLPAYSRLIVAAGGHVWAQIYSPDFSAPATWDVFDEARVWMGQVQTPAGFMAMSIAGADVAGVWRDDLGVEHVRVYRIRPN
jgi:6-bladed beta-propeller